MKEKMGFFLAAALVGAVFARVAVAAGADVPAIYVFGDDSVDVGNNNFLPENSPKANFRPYGIDFPGGKPTGRLSNGFIGIDYLAKNLGLRESPAACLSTTNESQALQGVNFASGGSGISDQIGKGISISLNQQIGFFMGFSRRLRTRVGGRAAARIVSKSIFCLSSGRNDLIVDYAQFGRMTQKQQTLFTGKLSTQLKKQLKTLYDLGGRKFLVFGTSLVGCYPIPRLTYDSGICVEYANNLSKQFNMATKIALKELASNLKGFSYSFIDVYKFLSVLSSDPLKYGFTEIRAACCGSGRLNAEFDCLPNTKFCSNRNKYLYWDPINYSQAFYETMIRVVSSGSRYATPVTIDQLARL